MFYQNQNCALFIDNSSLFYATRALGFSVDYMALRQYFAGQTALCRAKFYAVEMADADYSPIRSTLDWLTYNGFTTVVLPFKQGDDSADLGRAQQMLLSKKTVDALQMAPAINHAVFIDNSPALIPVIEALQDLGVTVTLVSTIMTTPHSISSDLRRAADHFLDLADLEDQICNFDRGNAA